MLRAVRRLRGLRPTGTTSILPTHSFPILPALPASSMLTRIEYKNSAPESSIAQLPRNSMLLTQNNRSYSHHKEKQDYRGEDVERLQKLRQTVLIATGIATVVAGAYVAHDYDEAKKGTKKRDSDKPLSRLDFLYIAMAKDEKERRELGLIPSTLFEAGRRAFTNGEKPEKWFDKMLLVLPSSIELPLYNGVAEFYFAHHQTKKAIQFLEHITESENMSPHYTKAAEACFKRQEFTEAEAYWKKAKVPMNAKFALIGNAYFEQENFTEALKYWEQAELKDIPAHYARVGQAYFEQNNIDQAIFCWEKARQNGHQSSEMLMQLGHIYLKKQENKHSEAFELFKLSLKLERDNPIINIQNVAISMNEMGVCLFMSALALQNKRFKEQQLNAILFLEGAASLSPGDSVIAMNLEIVKQLNETPVYGFPHRYLQCKVGEPTAMFNAIKQELIHYKTQTVNGSGVGTGVGLTYGNNGSSPTIVTTSTSCSMEVPRYENVLALDKLATLEMRQLHKQKVMAPAPDVTSVARPTKS